MSLNSGVAQSTIKTELDDVFFAFRDYGLTPDYAAATDPNIFMQSSTDRAAVIVEQFQSIGYFEQRGEQQALPEATPRVGNPLSFSVLPFSKRVRISKHLFDDEQWDVVNRMVADAGKLSRLSQDRHAMNQFNGSFSTILTNDGAALFSNSHTTLGGDTVDNLETGVMSPANLETLVQKLKVQVTQDGTLAGYNPRIVLVPPALYKETVEITKSELASQTGDNDLNYYSQVYPGLQVKCSPFLSAAEGGSDTAYFLLSDRHSMYRWVRQKLVTTFTPFEYEDNWDYVYAAEYREVVAPISFEGMVASDGSVS